MTLVTVLSAVGAIFIILYLLDTLLKTNPRYLSRLRVAGLEISLFTVKWSTTRYNSSLYWLSQANPSLCQLWYKVGAVVTSLMVLPSMLLLTMSVVQHVRQILTPETTEQAMLQPVLPGVNLPTSQLFYYITSLALASMFHEAGHAVAAYCHNIRMISAGLMVMAVFPAAFVELPTAELMSRSPRQQLTVYCGGVWHNVVMGVAAWSLTTITPLLMMPLYTSGAGVTVVGVTTHSVVTGPTGLVPGDIMTHLQGRPVNSVADFKITLADIISKSQEGLCIPQKSVSSLKISVDDDTNCCPSVQQEDEMCYHSASSKACLPVRKLVSKVHPSFCPCQETSNCWLPHLESNHSKLVIIERKNKLEYLYLGNPAFIYMDTFLSDYQPKFSWLPYSLPDIIIRTLLYIAAFSGGLAVLNVVPSYLLDGQHIVRVLVDILMPDASDINKVNVAMAMTMSGTMLVILNIVFGVYSILL